MYKETLKKFNSLFNKDDITVLGIESSCDETAAAVVRGKSLLSNVISSQINIHTQFGGVVPEVASRSHTQVITDVIQRALSEANITLNNIDAVAVTSNPGLIGSLLVGVSAAKSICLAKNIPLIRVNHIQAHICVNFLTPDLHPPFMALVASGGHTSIIDVRGYNDYVLVGKTCDDAIGEAFDKVARFLGLPYPGGPNVDRLAQQGSPVIQFVKNKGVSKDFLLSYSGLKTAVVNYVHNARQKNQQINTEDICASFNKQAVDLLVDTLTAAAQKYGRSTIAIAGGASANTYLRERLLQKGCDFKIIIPPKDLCTDNAVMVALRGFLSAREGHNYADLSLNASSLFED